MIAQLAGLKSASTPGETPDPKPTGLQSAAPLSGQTGPQAAAPPSGQAQAAGEPAPPVAAMARMGVTDQPSREEKRRPTVTRRGVAGKTGGQP